VVKRFFGGRSQADTGSVDSARGRAAIEESREIVVAVDREGRVVAASRRAREALPELAVGRLLPDSALRAVEVPYDANGSRETLVYLIEPEDNAAYDELRSGFTAAVSHELRTPLAHVNALSETLLLGRAESPEQAQRWLRAIHREGRRLSVLTENVLLHARGERRGIRAAPQWTDVGAVVHDAVSLVEAQAQARSARIVITGTAVDSTVGGAGGWVDAAAVRQIVINFIENALKFGPEGQTVTVTVDLERAAAPNGAGGLLRLSVDDEGPGVPHADRDRIWQPFVRLAEGGSAPTGTGLGLSVVRQLVAELGGRWSVFDVPGRGARFRVVLPLAAPPPQGVERVTEHSTSSLAQRQRFAANGR
jgi:signal transduction histidine kinase